jgi:hypothetical protein
VPVLQAVQPRYLGSYIPPDAEEYEYWLNGKDPQVQLFQVSAEQEQKVSPNHSDYLRWREERLRIRSEPESILDILHLAFPS